MLLPFSPHNPRGSVARYKRGAFVLTTDNCKINQIAPTLREVHKFSVSVTLKSTFLKIDVQVENWQLQTHRAGLQDFRTSYSFHIFSVQPTMGTTYGSVLACSKFISSSLDLHEQVARRSVDVNLHHTHFCLECVLESHCISHDVAVPDSLWCPLGRG